MVQGSGTVVLGNGTEVMGRGENGGATNTRTNCQYLIWHDDLDGTAVTAIQ